MLYLPALPVALCAAFLLPYSAEEEPVPLDQLLHNKRLSVQATGTGQINGTAIEAVVRNTSAGTIRAKIPAGWVFASVNERVQDLMVVRDEEFVLASGASRTIQCRAFCVQGPLSGPKVGEAYRSGAMGGAHLVSVAEAVAKGGYPDHLVQAAVWAVSNGYSIAGMGALDSSANDTLRMVTSRLSGQPPPRYAMRFVEEEGRACSGRPAAILRDFAMNVPAGAEFTAVVVNASGHIVCTLEERTLLEPGRHARQFEVQVLDWPAGRYAIHAYTTNGPGVHRLPFVL